MNVGRSPLLGVGGMGGSPSINLHTWNPKDNHFLNGCLVISKHFRYKDLVHHPIEPTIYKWLALGFQVGI